MPSIGLRMVTFSSLSPPAEEPYLSFPEISDYKPEIKPIQLFNNEAVNHLRATEGDELLFYFNLEEDANSLSVSLNFGNGNPTTL